MRATWQGGYQERRIQEMRPGVSALPGSGPTHRRSSHFFSKYRGVNKGANEVKNQICWYIVALPGRNRVRIRAQRRNFLAIAMVNSVFHELWADFRPTKLNLFKIAQVSSGAVLVYTPVTKPAENLKNPAPDPIDLILPEPGGLSRACKKLNVQRFAQRAWNP